MGVGAGFLLERISRTWSERSANKRLLRRAFTEIGDNHIFCQIVSAQGFEHRVRHLELSAIDRLMDSDMFYELDKNLQHELRNFRAWAKTFNAEIDVLQDLRTSGDTQGANDYIARLKKACADFDPPLRDMLIMTKGALRRYFWIRFFIEERIYPVLGKEGTL